MLTTARVTRPHTHTPVQALCMGLIVLAVAQLTSARPCGSCPTGSFSYGPWCIKNGIKCGPLHHDAGESCVKSYEPGTYASDPAVVCNKKHIMYSNKCYEQCPANANFQDGLCIDPNAQVEPPMAKQAWPRGLMCNEGSWLQDNKCRHKHCSAKYEWDGQGCRVKGCPMDTVDRGDKCDKATMDCQTPSV